MLPSVITGLIEAKVSVDRLQKYLLSEELDPQAVHRGNAAGPAAAIIESTTWCFYYICSFSSPQSGRLVIPIQINKTPMEKL